MKYKLVVLYWGSKQNKLIFTRDENKYKKSYEILSSQARKKGLDIFFSGLYFWNGEKFKQTLYFNGKGWIGRKNISPNLVFDKISTTYSNIGKKRILERQLPILNPVIFDTICNNKFLNYLIFEEFYPKSFLISNKKEFRDRLFHISTTKFVIKPNIGTCGEGVSILNKNELDKIKINKDHFVLQEFIDSSQGIKKIVAGVHDLRVTIVNNKISYAYIRTPAKGSLLCNIAQGGKMKNILPKDIPKNILLSCQKIMEKLSAFENLVYAVDFAVDKDRKPKLIEMNSRPGIYFYPQDEKDRDRYYSQLVDNFIDRIKKISPANN